MKYYKQLPNTRKTFMSTLKQKVKPQTIFFFDCETTITKLPEGEQHDFKLAVLRKESLECTRKMRKMSEWTFYTSEELNAQILQEIKRRHSITLMAHNISYDLQASGLFEYLIDHGFIVKSFFIKSTTTVIVLKSDIGKIVLLDSMNWFNSSLRRLGDDVGLPKQEIDFDTCTDKQLADYCANDVMVIARAMRYYKKWLGDNWNINLGYSRGSDSVSIFRKRRDQSKLWYNNNSKILAMEYSAYFGGRNEVHKFVKDYPERIYKLDVNSLYPFVMSNFKYSTRHIKHYDNPKIEKIRGLSDLSNVVALVRVNVDQETYPFRTKDALLFPKGRFETYLCGNELVNAFYNNHIEKILSCNLYTRANLFYETIQKLYKMRLEAKASGNTSDVLNIKLIMNSLYGKFGQLKDEWTNTNVDAKTKFGSGVYISDKIDEPVNYQIFNGKYYIPKTNILTMNTFPVVSAEIAANARYYLWTLMVKCGLDNVYYVDTDSIFTNTSGYLNLKSEIHDTQLGKMKLEGISTNTTIRGNKNYTFNDDTKIKGVPKSHVNVESSIYEFKRWRTFNEYLNSETNPKPMIRLDTKRLTEKYSKRLLQKDGNTLAWNFY